MKNKLFEELLNVIREKELSYNELRYLLSKRHKIEKGIFSSQLNTCFSEVGSDIYFCNKIGIDYFKIPKRKVLKFMGILPYYKKISFREWLDLTLREILLENKDTLKTVCVNRGFYK